MGNDSRKFVDLIYKASSKYPNWDPPAPIKAGDFGKINRDTGEFEIHGNIYKHPDTADRTRDYLPETTPPEAKISISSSGVKHSDLTIQVGANVAGLAGASIKGRWEFNSRVGALLLLHRPQISRIPPGLHINDLIDSPLLKDKCLVTQVISCPAYTLYLSTANKDVIDVALLGDIPVSPPVNAEGGVSASWWTQNGAGVVRQACDPKGSYCYTPLYTLKQRKRSIFRRDSPPPEPAGDNLWVDAELPWDPLDEDGEEDSFEDTVFDDESN